ncbi:hypothetical protein Poli38472_003641 [Pythium oligandrum]|uniref:t-SNARE coiled-coil homology domain-containing protein n=1 Tax=Pythium oligandrum TaxID=41045 RepID=A0A8K1CNI7_PYTOL|nr:hypothetical protein Poli38472_003641 [Pythium oligandrum]|eukprot:TMW65876.1 hypothetical protein Poli38472_003641 [Pythium oligandrum]
MADEAAIVTAFPPEFRSLEEDFVDSKIAINNSINEILDEGASPTAIQLAQSNIVEAQRCMKLMSLEVRGKSPRLRKAMQAKINLYREELQGLTRDLDRAQLMAKERKTQKRTANDTSYSQYDRIMANTNRLNKSTKSLEGSQRLIAETEQIGISVLDNLSSQRESLLSAHEKVRETREATSEARRILQRMARRIITNKIVLYSVIALLVISICVVIYHDFIKPSSASFFDI